MNTLTTICHGSQSRYAHLWRNALATLLLLIASTCSAEEFHAGDLVPVGHFTLGIPATGPAILVAVEYSNVTNFLGQGFINGGTALQGANQITRLVADDLTPTGVNVGQDVTQVKFSVANFNMTPVTVRARIRFWFDNAGTPGAYYNVPANVGFSFNPFTFNPGVTVLTGNIGAGLFSMPGAKFWAGLTFDDNNGTTAATTAEMDALGQGLFDPPTVGSSADVGFITTAAGSFFTTNNPAGSTFNLGGVPVTNFGWEFTANEGTTPVKKTTWSRLKTLYR